VIDLRASNEVQGIEDIDIPKTDVEFGIILSAPRMESNLHMYLERGNIIGFPSIDEPVEASEEDDSPTSAIHRKLGYSSFLYAATEEFAESLNDYELADPYSPKIEGVVKFFHDKKGYGFIEQNDDDETEDVFFHMAEIGGPDLEEGDRVRFEIIEEEEDGLRAKKLERI
jgi:CspA family cold shock protein